MFPGFLFLSKRDCTIKIHLLGIVDYGALTVENVILLTGLRKGIYSTKLWRKLLSAVLA